MHVPEVEMNEDFFCYSGNCKSACLGLQNIPEAIHIAELLFIYLFI